MCLCRRGKSVDWGVSGATSLKLEPLYSERLLHTLILKDVRNHEAEVGATASNL